MRFVQSRFEEVGHRLRSELALDSTPGSALDLAHAILPQDDSSLQWSLAGGGLTEDPSATLVRRANPLATHIPALRTAKRLQPPGQPPCGRRECDAPMFVFSGQRRRAADLNRRGRRGRRDRKTFPNILPLRSLRPLRLITAIRHRRAFGACHELAVALALWATWGTKRQPPLPHTYPRFAQRSGYNADPF